MITLALIICLLIVASVVIGLTVMVTFIIDLFEEGFTYKRFKEKLDEYLDDIA